MVSTSNCAIYYTDSYYPALLWCATVNAAIMWSVVVSVVIFVCVVINDGGLCHEELESTSECASVMRIVPCLVVYI